MVRVCGNCRWQSGITGSRLILIVWRMIRWLLRRRLIGRMGLKGRERRWLRCGIEGLQIRVGDWRSGIGRSGGRGRIGIQRIRRVRLGIASTGSAVTLVSIERRASTGCCHVSYLLRKLIWKLKSQWKQAVGWRKSYTHYTYDLQSYSLNFDNGFDDHLSPHSFR